jgi:trehalose/maltose hydrolase-like predicted phosphorylase
VHAVRLQPREVESWEQAAAVRHVPFDDDEFSEEQKRRNFDYYDPLTTGDSSLSACVQSIIAAEIGEERQALEYFQYALLMDLGNVAGNVSDGVHIPRPPAYGPRSSSGSAASATSAADCPSRA